MPVGNKEVFITFKVEKSRDFRREGADIHSDVVVSLSQAILGGTIRIPGIYEEVLLNIPAGTSSHTRIRLAGKGINRPHSYGRGDHYIHVKINVPVKLSDQQRALLKAFAETESGVEGTINGVTHTDDGKRAVDDPDGLVEELRKLLNPEKDWPDKDSGKI
jgi:DnaJ family protein A protein 3